jgi:hypothetical protein
MVGCTSLPAYTQNTSVVRSDWRSHDRITESNFVDDPCGVSIHERRLAVAAGRGTGVQAESQLYPAGRPIMRQSLKIGVLPSAKGFHERREKLLKVGHKAQEFPSGIWYDKETPNEEVKPPPSDAFGLLPIKNTGHVSIAFEFFAQGNASLMTSSAHDPQRVSSVPGFQTCVQVLLRDVMLFEQMMAFSLAMQSMHKPVASRMTVLILQYSSKSVAQLRERLG